MNYPVWQLSSAGGGLLIAAMAVFHVYIAHFAVGGGLFLVMTEIKGLRDNSTAILDYVHRHAKFFLLTTMVLGGMTGVGIWFTISLLSPAATSTLIHNFVFAWAIEWLFFVGEIVALFVYYYTFGRMNHRDHLRVGWLYFIFAWLSLFVINGVIGFMLTPGAWLTTHNFWDGFFNPSFWPALCLRTTLALMLAGLFGFVTATAIREEEVREQLVRYCALWLLAPFALFLASAYWYATGLPQPLHTLIFRRAPEIVPYVRTFVVVSPLLFAGGLLMAIRLPGRIKRPLAVIMLLLGLVYMGSFEFIREGGRRPYLIYDHTYSTSIAKADVPRLQEGGFLASARWVKNRQVTDKNRLAAGREVYNNLCLPCHSIGGPMHDILPLTAHDTPLSLDARLRGMGRGDTFMPPFAGNATDRAALVAFILQGLHARPPLPLPAPLNLAAPPAAAPLPFDPQKDDYVLLAWPEFGLNEATDADHLFGLLPAGNQLNAQLIRRGKSPQVVTDGVTLSVRYHGRATALTQQEGVFSATITPLAASVPGQEGYQPYPLVIVEARQETSGKLIAITQTVLPVFTDLGCRNCHGGPWRQANRAGLSDATANNILAAHDRLSHTDLLARAKAGKPAACRECHADPRFAAPGESSRINLSAALHGFHALYTGGHQGSAACHLCHATDPRGASRAFRGVHQAVGLDCVNCHGTMVDNAISLLRPEVEAGKAEASRLFDQLAHASTTPASAIKPRRPWVNEPDCLTCHQAFGAPESDTAFNGWNHQKNDLFRNRFDESGSLRCAACHNSAHALYPAASPYGANRDDLVPLQYQSTSYPIGSDRGCPVCHREEMKDEMHHANSLREMRNRE